MASDGLNDSERDIFHGLTTRAGSERAELMRLNSYYDCEQALTQLGLAIPPELSKFITIANWPRTTVDSIEERLDIEGFRVAGSAADDDEMWRIWQANNLDEESQLAHVDALVYGRSFATVGTNEADADTPIITVESPLEMTCELDTRTRSITAALRLFTSANENRASKATLYLPDATIWMERERGAGRWDAVDRDDHMLGEPPVAMLANRARTAAKSRYGKSQMIDVMGLTDACARALTNLQVAQETHAVPQRWALGVSKGDFVDQTGAPLPVWTSYFSAIWANQSKDATVGQFSASDLRNFQTVVELYAHLVSGVAGIPARYFGINTANPPSADGIRADEARLVKIAERRSRAFGGTWEHVQRLANKVKTGDADPKLSRLETIWRDPSTPTYAQKADGTVKLVQAGVLPREAAWQELGYNATRRAELKRMFAEQASDDLFGTVADSFRQDPVTTA